MVHLAREIKKAGLKRQTMPNNDRFDSSINRRFDLKSDIFSQSWFQSYVSELAKYGGNDVDCEVRLGHDIDNRVAFRDRQVWLDYVLNNWTKVVETNVWQYTGAIRRASCHHRRHHVLLSIRGENISQVEAVFQELCRQLSLETSPEDPYRYRRLSLEFEIGNWRPDLFVRGIKGIAAILGSDPDVPDAYAKTLEGDIEKLTPFFSLNAFSEGVETPLSKFTEIAIRMQARSMVIGIGVTSDHKKLRIRTNLDSDSKADKKRVNQLISAWPEELKLKPVKVQDENGASVAPAAPAASENPWLKYWLPAITGVIGAILAAGVVNLKQAVWPDYKVTITCPVVNSGIAKWPGDIVSLDWYIQPVQASFQPVKKDVVATVRVYSPSGSQQPIESKPPINFPLKPGTYVVVVDVAGAVPAQLQLVVGDTH
jgi:hypothetical protein